MMFLKIVHVTLLCRPLLKYACGIWDWTTQTLITKLEDIQSKATCFIKILEADMFLYQALESYQGLIHFKSVSSSRVLLGLDTLQNVRRNKRIALFHNVLQHESFFPNLLNTLDQIKTNHGFNTRHANSFISIVCITNKFLHSFLIRTARDLCIGENAVDSQRPF